MTCTFELIIDIFCHATFTPLKQKQNFIMLHNRVLVWEREGEREEREREEGEREEREAD